MKKILLLSGLSLILLATPGCKKDKTTLTNRRVPPPPPPPPTNTAPYVGIGDNLEKFPFSKIELFSWAYDEQEDSLSYSWAKVSGPESYRIENTDMPSTLISNLVNGKYKFEIAAKDASGLVGRDRTAMKVREGTTVSTSLSHSPVHSLTHSLSRLDLMAKAHKAATVARRSEGGEEKAGRGVRAWECKKETQE